MCGIVGAVGEIFLKDKDAFEWLLKFDVIRGPHSTGVARIRMQDDETELVKAVGTTWDLLKTKCNDFYNRDDGKSDIAGSFKVLMGHNRWATIGAVNEDNAHPFIAGNITGAHNGTLNTWAHKKLDDHDKFGTDSEGLMHNINIHGVEKVISNMEGAWALTWYDKSDKTFNILRNGERPLHFCWSASGKTFYYASESWMLYTALDKVGIQMAGEDDGVFTIAEDTHYKFDMSDMKNFGPNCVSKTTIEGYDWKKDYVNVSTVMSSSGTVSGSSANNPFHRGLVTGGFPPLLKDVEAWVGKYEQFFVDAYCTDDNGKDYVSGWFRNIAKVEVRVYAEQGSKTFKLLDDSSITDFYGKLKKVKRAKNGRLYATIDLRTVAAVTWSADYIVPPSETKDLDVGDEIPWGDFLVMRQEPANMNVVGYDGKHCTPAEFYYDTGNGCAWCSVQPQLHDSSTLKWLGKNTFLCEDCHTNPEILQYSKMNS